MYIDQRKLWRGHTLRKMKAGDIEEAHRVIDENDFKHVKYIIVHVGTNQVEKGNIAAEISSLKFDGRRLLFDGAASYLMGPPLI